jgi:hypothetical protein
LTCQPIDFVWFNDLFLYSKFAGFDMIGIQFLANSDAMKHKKRIEPNRDLYRPLLIDIIDQNHELVRLEKLLDWEFFEREWNGFFPSTTGTRHRATLGRRRNVSTSNGQFVSS